VSFALVLFYQLRQLAGPKITLRFRHLSVVWVSIVFKCFRDIHMHVHSQSLVISSWWETPSTSPQLQLGN